MLVAITRDVSPSIVNCELTHLNRVSIDVGRARAQHRAYETALADAGCALVHVAPAPDCPDAVFVEDTAMVFDPVAVIARPGAESRRLETATVADTLRSYRPLVFMTPPATIDGGDVLTMGHQVFVGLSSRTNSSAVEQLRAALVPHGYTVEPVTVAGCLHLKSAVTAIDDGTVLINAAWAPTDAFAAFRVVEVDASEPAAANIVRAGDQLIYPTAFPRTHERLERAGYVIRSVDVSELQKAEGAVTCCSIIFTAGVGSHLQSLQP
jgi:dimethylargininase